MRQSAVLPLEAHATAGPCPVGLKWRFQRKTEKPPLCWTLPSVSCAGGWVAWQPLSLRPARSQHGQRRLLPPRVWNVRYNHSHDQLVLTGSSDSRVILSNMVSISSEPFGHLVDDDDLSDQEERRLEEK